MWEEVAPCCCHGTDGKTGQEFLQKSGRYGISNVALLLYFESLVCAEHIQVIISTILLLCSLLGGVVGCFKRLPKSLTPLQESAMSELCSVQTYLCASRVRSHCRCFVVCVSSCRAQVPDIYDSAKYDALHNAHLGLGSTLEELYTEAKILADAVIPNE